MTRTQYFEYKFITLLSKVIKLLNFELSTIAYFLLNQNRKKHHPFICCIILYLSHLCISRNSSRLSKIEYGTNSKNNILIVKIIVADIRVDQKN